jgi:hypothetical protein
MCKTLSGLKQRQQLLCVGRTRLLTAVRWTACLRVCYITLNEASRQTCVCEIIKVHHAQCARAWSTQASGRFSKAASAALTAVKVKTAMIAQNVQRQADAGAAGDVPLCEVPEDDDEPVMVHF